MSYSIKQLRDLPDSQLINEHDLLARHTATGTQYYIDELDRRSRERFENSARVLSLVGVLASVAAVITSVIALFT